MREKISRVAATEKARAAMLKDIHLLEAAIASDKLVAALDETVRELFATASTRVGEIKNIVWVNPAKEEETPIEWLEAGARSEKGRRIGFQEKN